MHMCLFHHIPFQCNIQGYPCRVSYSGQPLKCTICSGAHKAADCPDRNKCKRCHQAGHFAKDCVNAWNTTSQAGGVPHPPAGGSNPPAPVPPAPPAPSVPSAFSTAPVPPAPPAPSASDSVHEPVPFMSIDLSAPQQNADVEFTDAAEEVPESQVSLFSQSDSIDDFSEEDLGPSPSPSTSSITSPSGCSYSILKNLPIVSSDSKVVEQIPIVSSDPKVVEQINPIVSSNPKVVEQIVVNSSFDNNSSNNDSCESSSSMDIVVSSDLQVVRSNSSIPPGAKVSSGPTVNGKNSKVSGIPKLIGKRGGGWWSKRSKSCQYCQL